MSLLPKNAGIFEFKILDHLGSGGFANTYLARDENLDKEVAIKEFFRETFASAVTISTCAPKRDTKRLSEPI